MSTLPLIKRTTIMLSALYVGVFIAMLVTHPGSDQFYTDFNNTYQILPPLFAAFCGMMYARRAQHLPIVRRWGWALIGVGALSFAIGQMTWTFYESILALPELPSPGPADVGYLGTYPLLIVGVILLFGSMPIIGRARLVLDGALAASSVAMLSWYFLVSQLWHNPDVSVLGKAISVAYPLGDVAVLLCAIILLSGRTTDDSLRRSLGFLAGGISLIAFADTLFSYYNLKGIYVTGSWFDWGWSFGWLLIAYAALLPLWWPLAVAPPVAPLSPYAKRLGTVASLLAPYLAVVIAFVVIIWYDVRPDSSVRLNVLLTGMLLVLVVVLRQVLTLLENRKLTSQLQLFTTDLEHMVVRRTDQLNSLFHLTRAVNTTLKVDQVMIEALRHTQQALEADAVVIRLLSDKQTPITAQPPITKHLGLDGHDSIAHAIEQTPFSSSAEIRQLGVQHAEDTLPTPSYVQAPMVWQQQVIGAIGVVRWKSAFNATDAEMLDSIGLEVGSALENARLYAVAVDAADRDAVTNLYNHRAIHQQFNNEFLLATQHDRPLTIVMVDLNNFKLFNDTYGHPIGDQVLKRVAHVLTSECRSTDIIGRYGGDEFLVLLPNTDATTAFTVAERLRDRMTVEGFSRAGDQRVIPITLSFGLATFPIDSTNRHELLTIADANLYTAKQSEDGIRGTTDHQRANQELRAEGTFEVLDALVTAVDNKDRYTRRHSEDVTEYALWLGEQIGLSEETLRITRIGCLLHDVGKIGVPDEILRKPGRLTSDEFDAMKRHPRLGALIVSALPGMEVIVDIVRSHHERWDGQGYPDRLRGEDIPLLGRLVALADAFSAMTTDRPYRKGLNWQSALDEIQRNAGTQFDPIMTQHFIHAIRDHLAPSGIPALAAPVVPLNAPTHSTAVLN